MGALATPSYIAYVTLTMVLAFNRLMLMYSPQLEDKFFNKSAVDVWLGSVVVIWSVHAICLSLPWATISYVPEKYSWSYDYSRSLSRWVQKSEMLIEFSNIFLSTVFYAFTIGILCRTRKRFLARSSYRSEMKIFIQALTITIYCTILNLLWHNSKAVLPANIWSHMVLNMMWILSAGINPLMYFIVNRVIREQMAAHCSNVTTIQLFKRPKRFLRLTKNDRILEHQ
ncbi:Serpentine type 7TM GPCR chemoreceptor Srt [Parelaphostrongylus tenuis]|uniref:Serpentine type 7TM GPCR chemoreceptor Srt n=1 Tax=Parelaphostrongylus tenuis TaxID=148309 RepID=A0AAD5MQE4_PARTN|nr:Serpentine type 7TM GPCR chemoreceptor Srt [Parelaphostrongylus tenuis]